MVPPMPPRRAPAVTNHLPAMLRRQGVSWGELGRRTFLPGRVLVRLRVPGANPRLAVAERVAAALGVPVERLFRLRAGR